MEKSILDPSCEHKRELLHDKAKQSQTSRLFPYMKQSFSGVVSSVGEFGESLFSTFIFS